MCGPVGGGLNCVPHILLYHVALPGNKDVADVMSQRKGTFNCPVEGPLGRMLWCVRPSLRAHWDAWNASAVLLGLQGLKSRVCSLSELL